MIPSTLARPGAAVFWLAVLLTGVGAGVAAAILTQLLELVQHTVWGSSGTDLLSAAEQTSAWRHILILLGAGLVTGGGQIVLKHLSSGNGIDITAAIWFHAGRLPTLRTVGSALLSVLIVGMGVSLGREGAPKQAGAAIANVLSDRGHLYDEERRLLVACGAGAGMAAAYGVPLGGALFALEVMRGMLALRFILPALVTSLVAVSVSVNFPPRRTHLHHPCGFQFPLHSRLGAGGRSDRGGGLCRICSDCGLGGSKKAEGMETPGRSGASTRPAWCGIGSLPADPW